MEEKIVLWFEWGIGAFLSAIFNNQCCTTFGPCHVIMHRQNMERKTPLAIYLVRDPSGIYACAENDPLLCFMISDTIRYAKEEVVIKTQSNEKLKVEAEKCLAQSEKFINEKAEFETAIYAKFLGVLNSKKAKLRELRDQLSKQDSDVKVADEEEESTDKTETFDDSSDNEKSEDESTMNLTSISKDIPSRPRGRKRK